MAFLRDDPSAADDGAPRSPAPLSWLALAAIFAGALRGGWLGTGGVPMVWVDTLVDEDGAYACLTGHACRMRGPFSSVAGLAAPTGWLDIRTFGEWLGIGVIGAFRVQLLLDAAALALIAWAGARLGGRTAGVLAAFFFTLCIAPADVGRDVLFNATPMRFLGAAFLVSCIAALERPSNLSIMLAALTGAVMANVHPSSVFVGVSVIAVAAAVPAHRWESIAVGAGTFAGATVMISPPSWLNNISWLLSHPPGTSGPSGDSALPLPRAVVVAVIALVVIAVSWWLGAAILKRREARQPLDVSVIVALPPILAALGGLLTGAFQGLPGKYLSHAGPAVAVASALAVTQMLASAARYVPSGREKLARWAGRAAPYAVATWVAVHPVPNMRETAGAVRPRLDFADLAAAGKVLTKEGFSWPDVTRIQSPNEPLAGRALRLFLPEALPASGPDESAGIVLLKVSSSRLPSPVPPSWVPVRVARGQTTVVVPSRSWLDWRRFEAGKNDEAYGETGLQPPVDHFPFSPVTLPGVPLPPFHEGEQLVLRVPLHVPTQVLDGEVALVNLPGECPAALMPFATGPVSDRARFSFTRRVPGVLPPSAVRVVYASLNRCQVLRVPPLVLQGSPEEVLMLESTIAPTGLERP